MTDEQFETLYDVEVQHLVRRIVGKYASTQQSDAEDLSQEVMTKVWLAKDKFEIGTDFPAFVNVVARNYLVSQYRKLKAHRQKIDRYRKASGTTHKEQALPDEGLDASERHQAIMKALSQIPDVMADTIVLVDLNGLQYKEAAERMNCPTGTVMSRLHRGRQKLAEILNPDELK